MKSIQNIPPPPTSTAATDEPAVPATPGRRLPACRISERLVESQIEPALDAGRDSRPGRAQRVDGWTPERLRIFLDALAECGVVADAARAAGLSEKSAYNLRNRTVNRAFHLAWNAAEQLARRRISGDLMSRAIHGCVELIMRDGEVWGERHRYDNRLTMAVLTRLDRKAEADDQESRTARIVAQEFDQFLDIVCSGGEGGAEFLAARPEGCRTRDARLLERAGNYRRYGVGLPKEIPVSDLDPDDQASWTEEQQERAERSRLLADPDGAEDNLRVHMVREILVDPADRILGPPKEWPAAEPERDEEASQVPETPRRRAAAPRNAGPGGWMA